MRAASVLRLALCCAIGAIGLFAPAGQATAQSEPQWVFKRLLEDEFDNPVGTWGRVIVSAGSTDPAFPSDFDMDDAEAANDWESSIVAGVLMGFFVTESNYADTLIDVHATGAVTYPDEQVLASVTGIQRIVYLNERKGMFHEAGASATTRICSAPNPSQLQGAPQAGHRWEIVAAVEEPIQGPFIVSGGLDLLLNKSGTLDPAATETVDGYFELKVDGLTVFTIVISDGIVSGFTTDWEGNQTDYFDEDLDEAAQSINFSYVADVGSVVEFIHDSSAVACGRGQSAARDPFQGTARSVGLVRAGEGGANCTTAFSVAGNRCYRPRWRRRP